MLVPTPFHGHSLGALHTAPDIRNLIDEVAVEIPSKWKEMATGLGIDSTDIARIEQDVPPSKFSLCFLAVFETWKKKSPYDYTWDTLLRALETEAVNGYSIAKAIRLRLTD